MDATVVYYFLFAVLIQQVSAKLPDYIKVCHENEPNITQCITDSVLHLRPKLKTGISDIGLVSLEPMAMDDTTLKSGTQAVRLEINMTDVKAHGISNFELVKLKVNMKHHKFWFRVKLPGLHFDGKYSMESQLLFLNVKGEGSITGNFTDYYFTAQLNGHKITRDGIEYLEFDRMKLKIDVGKMNLHLDNLFNGDKVLGDTTNAAINENSDLILNEIKPSLENSVAEQCTNIANKITQSFPYSELFPK